MDRSEFYELIDIENPEEFKYYDSFATILEADEVIDENLVEELFLEVDREILSEFTADFFDDIKNRVPDSESDLYMIFEMAENAINYRIENPDDENVGELAAEIVKFHKWYSLDANVFSIRDSEYVCVRDAIYTIEADKLLEKEISEFDFSAALDYDLDYYEVSIYDLVDLEGDE